VDNFKKKLIVTTALEETWGKDSDIIFLGEWCCLYSREFVRNKRQYKVLPYHWSDNDKAFGDYQYLRLLNKKTLTELTVILNRIHGEDYSEKTWSILIGHWLVKFVAVVFDRWSVINTYTGDQKYVETIMLETNPKNHVPADSDEAMVFFIEDGWNHFLYGKMIEDYTNISIKILSDKEPCAKIPVKKYQSLPLLILLTAKSTLKGILLRLKLSFFKKGIFIFESTYLRFFDELKLNALLRWSASYISFDTLPRVNYNEKFRKWNLDAKGADSEFEKILKDLLPVFMPRSFLEGYKSNSERDIGRNFTHETKVIFTSNSHYNNDAFKFYAMKKVSKGVRLVIGQHGGGSFNKYQGAMDFELFISDKYLSPGNGNNKINSKVEGVGQLFNRLKSDKYNKNGPALLVTVAMPRYSFCLFSAALSSQMIDYFNDQFLFFKNLTPEIQGKLLVRTYHGDYSWGQKERWIDKFPNIMFDNNRKMDKSVQQSRLLISTYSATTYNQTLAANVPTIFYWDTSCWKLSKESDYLFEKLKKVGIFHATPQSASTQVVKIWDDIEKWWQDPELQSVRREYCRAYAYRTSDLTNNIKMALKDQNFF
jgi:putative transferase (TIGR04331 family)